MADVDPIKEQVYRDAQKFLSELPPIETHARDFVLTIVCHAMLAERRRCEALALITVHAGDSSLISVTGKLIADAIRSGEPAR